MLGIQNLSVCIPPGPKPSVKNQKEKRQPEPNVPRKSYSLRNRAGIGSAINTEASQAIHSHAALVCSMYAETNTAWKSCSMSQPLPGKTVLASKSKCPSPVQQQHAALSALQSSWHEVRSFDLVTIVAQVHASAANNGPGAVRETYDDSSVLQYVCQDHAWGKESSSSTSTMSGFVEMPGWLADPKLTRAYR